MLCVITSVSQRCHPEAPDDVGWHRDQLLLDDVLGLQAEFNSMAYVN